LRRSGATANVDYARTLIAEAPGITGGGDGISPSAAGHALTAFV
jgi:hypothetical protein